MVFLCKSECFHNIQYCRLREPPLKPLSEKLHSHQPNEPYFSLCQKVSFNCDYCSIYERDILIWRNYVFLMQSKRTGPYCVNNTRMSVQFLKKLKNAIWRMQITTWRFEESPRPEAAWKQADGGLLHVDTWGQTRPPLGVQDGGGCALDSWKIHEKWQKLSSYKDFSVTNRQFIV